MICDAIDGDLAECAGGRIDSATPVVARQPSLARQRRRAQQVGLQHRTSTTASRDFDGRSEFQADDVADFPNLAMRLFATPSMAHLVFSNCVGPVEMTIARRVEADIARLQRALGGADRRRPSWAR